MRPYALTVSHDPPADPGDRESLERLADPVEVLTEVESLLTSHIDPEAHPFWPYLQWRLNVRSGKREAGSGQTFDSPLPAPRSPLHASGSPLPMRCPACHEPTPHREHTPPFSCVFIVIGELREQVRQLQAQLLRLQASHAAIALIEQAIDRCVERAIARED